MPNPNPNPNPANNSMVLYNPVNQQSSYALAMLQGFGSEAVNLLPKQLVKECTSAIQSLALKICQTPALILYPNALMQVIAESFMPILVQAPVKAWTKAGYNLSSAQQLHTEVSQMISDAVDAILPTNNIAFEYAYNAYTTLASYIPDSAKKLVGMKASTEEELARGSALFIAHKIMDFVFPMIFKVVFPQANMLRIAFTAGVKEWNKAMFEDLRGMAQMLEIPQAQQPNYLELELFDRARYLQVNGEQLTRRVEGLMPQYIKIHVPKNLEASNIPADALKGIERFGRFIKDGESLYFGLHYQNGKAQEAVEEFNIFLSSKIFAFAGSRQQYRCELSYSTKVSRYVVVTCSIGEQAPQPAPQPPISEVVIEPVIEQPQPKHSTAFYLCATILSVVGAAGVALLGMHYTNTMPNILKENLDSICNKTMKVLSECSVSMGLSK